MQLLNCPGQFSWCGSRDIGDAIGSKWTWPHVAELIESESPVFHGGIRMKITPARTGLVNDVDQEQDGFTRQAFMLQDRPEMQDADRGKAKEERKRCGNGARPEGCPFSQRVVQQLSDTPVLEDLSGEKK